MIAIEYLLVGVIIGCLLLIMAHIPEGSYLDSIDSPLYKERLKIKFTRKKKLPLLLGHVQFKVNQEYLEERLKR